MADAGAGDGAVVSMRHTAGPCDTDLLVNVGRVSPQFGALGASMEFSGDPSDLGSFGIYRSDASIPNLAEAPTDATFYAPSLDGGGSVADGKFAFVVVIAGSGSSHRSYEHFTLHLASHGFLVLGITLPDSIPAMHNRNAAQALAAIDYALGDPKAGAIAEHIDETKIAVAGHSFGGKIAFYVAALDPRIDLVIGWDPSNAGGFPCMVDPLTCNTFPVAPSCAAHSAGLIDRIQAESIIFRAAPDGTNPDPDDNALNFFRGAPAPATLVDYDATVQHVDFGNPLAAVISRARRIHLAFLLNRFYGTKGLLAWLPLGSDIGVGAVRVLYKP